VFTKKTSKRSVYYFKNVINTTCSIYAIFFLIGYFFPENDYSNKYTIILDVLIVIIVIIFNNLKKEKRSNIVSYISLLYLIFVFPRLLSYIYLHKYIRLPFDKFDNEIINSGLEIFLLSTLALYIGCTCSKLVYKNHIGKNQELTGSLSSVGIVITGILILALEIFVNQLFQYSTYILNVNVKFNTLIQIFKTFISFETYILLILIIYYHNFYQKRNTNNFLFILLIFYLIFIVYCLISGTRGAGVRTALELIAIFLVLEWIQKDHKNYITSIFFILAIITIISFPLGNEIRNNISEKQRTIIDLNIKDINTKLNKTQYTETTSLILDRIGIIDYAVLIPYGYVNVTNKEKILNLTYIYKSTINTFLPGNPYSEAPLISSRAINVIYRNFDYDYPLTHGYFSEYWTSSALLFILFGAISIPAHFIIGFIIELGMTLLQRSSFEFSIPLQILYLFLLPFHIIFSMGIEHTLLTIVVVALQFITAYLLCRGFTSLLYKYNIKVNSEKI